MTSLHDSLGRMEWREGRGVLLGVSRMQLSSTDGPCSLGDSQLCSRLSPKEQLFRGNSSVCVCDPTFNFANDSTLIMKSLCCMVALCVVVLLDLLPFVTRAFIGIFVTIFYSVVLVLLLLLLFLFFVGMTASLPVVPAITEVSLKFLLFRVPDAVVEYTRPVRDALNLRAEAREQAQRATKAEARLAERRMIESRRAAKVAARRVAKAATREAAEAAQKRASEKVARKLARERTVVVQRQVKREVSVREATVERKVEEMVAREEEGVPVPLSFDELDVATSSFGTARVIGVGGNAAVYKADPLPSLSASPLEVAVKRLALKGGAAVVDELRQEVDILRRLSHMHVLPLLGYCLDSRGPSLVYPLAVGGNLEDRLLLTAQAPFTEMLCDVERRGDSYSSYCLFRGGSGSGNSVASRHRYRGLRAAGSFAR